MILFIYGEDTYRSKQKIDAIKAKYISASLGDTNLAIADVADKNIDFTQITRMVLAMPFLAKKRLAIIKNLLSTKNKKLQEQVGKLIDKVPETTLLVFYEEEVPDQRSSLFKKLKKVASTEEFKKPDEYALKKWIKETVAAQGGSLEPQALEKLILYVGGDLWRLDNEMNKIISYRGTPVLEHSSVRGVAEEPRNIKTITVKDVELLVRPNIQSNIFAFIDALGRKNIQRAREELQRLLTQGEHELYIISMIVYQFRNLLIVKDLLERGKTASEIPSQSGLHPFVVQKSISQASGFSLSDLKKIYRHLLETDLDIKTGVLEPCLALDLLMVKIVGFK